MEIPFIRHLRKNAKVSKVLVEACSALQSFVLQLFCLSYIMPNFNVYPLLSLMLPLLQLTTLSAMVNASGPLTLITEIAPVPGMVAGAHIVSSFRMYILSVFRFLRLTSPGARPRQCGESCVVLQNYHKW